MVLGLFQVNYGLNPHGALRLHVGMNSQFLSHSIHGTGIFTYIWLIFMVNVGKYTVYRWYGYEFSTSSWPGGVKTFLKPTVIQTSLELPFILF